MVAGFLSAYEEYGWLPQWPSPGIRGAMVRTQPTFVLSLLDPLRARLACLHLCSCRPAWLNPLSELWCFVPFMSPLLHPLPCLVHAEAATCWLSLR